MEELLKKDFRCDAYWAEQIELCLNIAVKAHSGQMDKVGLPVILHPLTVGGMGNTAEEVCVGFLHDTIEDTEVTEEGLLKYGVDKDVVACVKILTHADGVSYEDYVKYILDSGNKTAINVKHYDLAHNSKRASIYGFSKQIDKYRRALKLFDGHSPNPTQVPKRYDAKGL